MKLLKWHPGSDLTIEETDEINRERINDVVCDVGGEKRNADMQPHPWNMYWICQVEIFSSEASKIYKCGEVSPTEKMANEHALTHRK